MIRDDDKEYNALPGDDVDMMKPGENASSSTSSSSNLRASTINLTASSLHFELTLTLNQILGAGMLGLPYGFAQAGWGVALIMLIGSGCLSAFTMHLLSLVSQEVGKGRATFFMLAERALPGYGGLAVETSVLLNVFGLSTSYLVVFGSTMPYVVGKGPGETLLTNPHLWVTIALGIVGPLSFLPTLDSLSFASALGMASVFYVLLLVIFYFFHRPGGFCGEGSDDSIAHCGGAIDLVVPDIGLLKMLGIATFAYTAHVQCLGVANEVKDYAQPKMDSVIRSALGFAALVYFSLGFCGYFSFGTVVQGNILLSYPSTILVAFARVAISLLVCICYPLQQKPGRDSFLGLLRMSTTLAWRESATSRGTYIGFTSTYLALSYAVAMSVVNYPSALNVIISLLGSTTSTLIAYVIPTVVYSTLHPEPHLKRTLAIGVCCFGLISMPLCIFATFV